MRLLFLLLTFFIGVGDALQIVPHVESADLPCPWDLGHQEAVPRQHFFFEKASCRIGEAKHPGPTWAGLDLADQHLVRIGCSNPSGLRRKETEAVGLGPGIWSYSETQLSEVTLPTCSRLMKSLAAQEHRRLWTHSGAAVRPRANSSWAGSWSGVLVTSDFKARGVQLPWPTGLFPSGRVCASQHHVGQLPILVITWYGFPRGPTFPEAPALNSRMLDFLTTEILLGASGPRVILGDFNLSAHGSPFFEQWRQLGWEDAQTYASLQWGWTKVPTSKGSKESDMIWLSPEALRLMHNIEVQEIFAEHSTLSVDLHVPPVTYPLRAWPRPQPIPWGKLAGDLDFNPPQERSGSSSTTQLAGIFHDFEKQVDSHLNHHGHGGLSKQALGRAQRTEAESVHIVAPMARPSRQGEVQLRSDLTGNEVRRWFRQLRRLQAMAQSLWASNWSVNACVYRIELWSSILKAPGFAGGFAWWWDFHRPLGWDEAPWSFPSCIPEAAVVDTIFRVFRVNFEHLESWHLRQRGRQLSMKHDRTMKALYQELKDPPKGSPSLLYHEEDFQVIAVRPDGHYCLDPQPQPGLGCVWTAGALRIEVAVQEDGSCILDDDILLQPGAMLQRTQHIHTTHDVHSELLDLWVKRWQARVQPTAAEWQRITGFFHRHVPSLDIQLPPLLLEDWRRTLKKYGERAAKGLDGISHLDLRFMPDCYVLSILQLLSKIEEGELDWPKQMLVGVCHAIAKIDGAHEAGAFRPIVVLSIIYRTWSALRARQLISQVAPFLPPGQYGFVPEKEPLELWMSLQGEIEVALMAQGTLAGLSSDLVKAFNNIPRLHSEALGKHLGVPSCVLKPWMSYLQGLLRAFSVDGFLSSFVSSSVGMPEGDSLSVFSMIQLDMSYHLYMRAFAPNVRCGSFVDNLAIQAEQLTDLLGGWAACQTYFSLWNLAVDRQKTFFWSTSSTHRQQLRALDFSVCDHASELGGAMQFGKKTTYEHFQNRARALAPKWQRLTRSKAPLHLKQRALYTVMWPKALHGSNALAIPMDYFTQLRGEAMKALHLGRAGANPTLRLSIVDNPCCDPGFYYLHRLVQDFARLCGKDCVFASRWNFVMGCFPGELLPGPFATLATCLNVVGWRVEAPFFVDHDGCRFDFLQTDPREVFMALEDAWLQHVARTVNHRQTMADLSGLNGALVRLCSKHYTPLEVATLRAIQSGSFLAPAAQAKFDLTKKSVCSFCGGKDSHEHWLGCAGYSSHWHGDSPSDVLAWPLALRAHLLPARNPHTAQIKMHLHTIHTAEVNFLSSPSGQIQHLFTDGAARSHEDPVLSLASWAVVNACSGFAVATGPVAGLLQTSDVAEITAVKHALLWAVHWRVQVHLWIDSKFVSDALFHLLRYHTVPRKWTNQHLWAQILDILQELADLEPELHWIPSHLDESQLRDPFDDWWHLWNSRADAVAARTNEDRPTDFATLHRHARAYHDQQKERMRLLGKFYLSIAASKDRKKKETYPVIEDNCIDLAATPLGDSLCADWALRLKGAPSTERISVAFCEQLFRLLLHFDDAASTVFTVSVIELVFILLEEDFSFPFWDSKQWRLQKVSAQFQRPTLAYLLSVVRASFKFSFGVFGLSFERGLDRSSYSICFPTDGISFRISHELLSRAQHRLARFCGRRLLRKACDLARPI